MHCKKGSWRDGLKWRDSLSTHFPAFSVWSTEIIEIYGVIFLHPEKVDFLFFSIFPSVLQALVLGKFLNSRSQGEKDPSEEYSSICSRREQCLSYAWLNLFYILEWHCHNELWYMRADSNANTLCLLALLSYDHWECSKKKRKISLWQRSRFSMLLSPVATYYRALSFFELLLRLLFLLLALTPGQTEAMVLKNQKGLAQPSRISYHTMHGVS